MKERITKLLTVKSVITITLTALVFVQGLRGVISSNEILTIYTTVIAFYFGTQQAKKEE